MVEVRTVTQGRDDLFCNQFSVVGRIKSETTTSWGWWRQVNTPICYFSLAFSFFARLPHGRWNVEARRSHRIQSDPHCVSCTWLEDRPANQRPKLARSCGLQNRRRDRIGAERGGLQQNCSAPGPNVNLRDQLHSDPGRRQQTTERQSAPPAFPKLPPEQLRPLGKIGLGPLAFVPPRQPKEVVVVRCSHEPVILRQTFAED